MRDRKYVEFDQEYIVKSAYRPFAKRYLYFDRLLLNSIYLQGQFFPINKTQSKNYVVCVSGLGHDVFQCAITSQMPELKFSNAANGGTQCFPFYVYDKDGSNRRENITDWSLKEFRTHYKNQEITKWEIFYYIYGVLHHPGYREKYGDCLKRELPRIPYAPAFNAFASAGKKLAGLHLEYEDIEPYSLKRVFDEEWPPSYNVEKMRLAKDKKSLAVNDSLTLTGIPAETFEYRLGNRSALDWVIDQYRVKVDKRSGIKSDPNRKDDEEYIVRLVGQVVQVSVETVRLVEALPEDFGG